MRAGSRVMAALYCFIASSGLALAAEEHVPSIDTHELFWKALNFAILVGGLAYLLKKPVQLFFRSRKEGIVKELHEVRRARDEALARLKEIEATLAKTDAEKEAILTSSRKDAETARERLLEAATAEADRIRSSAKFEIARMTEQSRRDLKTYAAALYTEAAEELIRQEIGPEDEARLRRKFLERLEGGEAA